MGDIPADVLESLEKESNSMYLDIEDVLDKKIRITQPPIAAIKYWSGKKPHIVPLGTVIPPEDIDQHAEYGANISKWWGLAIYIHEDKKIGVLGIKQKTIRDRLAELDGDPDLGGFLGHDIKIKKKIEGGKTSYSVTPLPAIDLSLEATKLIGDNPIDLDSLIEIVSEEVEEPETEADDLPY